MIVIAITDTATDVTARATVPGAHGPSLRSAVQEMRNELGERLSGLHKFDKEDALTRASNAVNAFAGALNAVVLTEDKDYD